MPATKHLGLCLWILSIAATLIVLLIIASGNPSQVQAFQAAPQAKTDGLIHSVKGADLFAAYCASCHGVHGAGNGPAAEALKRHPPDLTRIAQRYGGNFPEGRVRKIIAGDASISAHGSREMPVWGPIFHQVEQDQDWGNVRLQNLTKYLQSIQKESIRKK